MYFPGQAFCSHDALEDELHSKLSKHGVASLNVVEGVFITFLHAWEVPLQELSWPIVAHILPSQYTFTVPPTYYTFEVTLGKALRFLCLKLQFYILETNILVNGMFLESFDVEFA